MWANVNSNLQQFPMNGALTIRNGQGSPGGIREGHTEDDMVDKRLELKGGCKSCNYLSKKHCRWKEQQVQRP